MRARQHKPLRPAFAPAIAPAKVKP
jgi:hypothetical protein